MEVSNMKKNSSLHFKKKTSKDRASKAKSRKISSLSTQKLKVHTKTKKIRAQKTKENLLAAALKLPNKNLYSKEDIAVFIENNNIALPKKEIKLILNKMNSLTEEELSKYRTQRIMLGDLIKAVISSK